MTILRIALIVMAAGLMAQSGRPLLNGKNLDNWEKRGDAQWAVNKEGVLIGQRTPVRPWPAENSAEWRPFFYRQAWLYTKDEFENFDLSLEYWLPVGGNSGIALRDTSRGEAGIQSPPDFTKTPSKVAYEIQLNNQYPDDHRSGSIYGLAKAPDGLQNDYDWNRIEIAARADKITVRINGKLAAEHAVPPDRPKRGPIGLQLHDQKSVVMFRNIRLTPR